MIIKIKLEMSYGEETYASTWQEALEYASHRLLQWGNSNPTRLPSALADYKILAQVLDVVKTLSPSEAAEIHPTLNGTYFVIEKLNVTENNERIFDYLWKYRCRGGIDNGWVNRDDIKEDLALEKMGTITGTITGFMKKGIAESQSFTLPDGKIFKYFRIKREHVYGR